MLWVGLSPSLSCYLFIVSTGRLLYTTGDTEGAVRFFLSLLIGSPNPVPLPTVAVTNGDASLGNRENTDKVFLDDFRVAVKVPYHIASSSFSELTMGEAFSRYFGRQG